MNPGLRRPLSALAAGLVLLAGAPVAAGTLEISGPAGVAVSVNDEDLGPLPLSGPLVTRRGEYLIRASLPGYLPFEQTVVFLAEDDVLRVAVRLLPMSRRTAWSSSILYAGLGQFYLGDRTRGWIYATAETGGLLAALFGELERSNLRKDYLAIRSLYEREINAEEILRLRAEMEATYDDMTKAEDMRNMGLMVAVGAVVISAADAFLSFPAIEAGPGLVPVQTGRLEPDAAGPSFASLHAGLRMDF